MRVKIWICPILNHSVSLRNQWVVKHEREKRNLGKGQSSCIALIIFTAFHLFCHLPLGFLFRYETWDDPEVPKFHYGSHYSSAGIVLFYLLRLPPFSVENQKLQGGQFDHADRLFNSIRDTWLSAAGKGNTSDVKELIPEFFYIPEFLENRFNLDLGEKQSGEKVCF